MKKMLNEGYQIHEFISSSGSGTVINYGSGSDFLTSYGSGSTSQKVTVPTVPVPVPNGKSYGSYGSGSTKLAQQEQGDSKSRATAKAGQQKEQGDSKSRATARTG